MHPYIAAGARSRPFLLGLFPQKTTPKKKKVEPRNAPMAQTATHACVKFFLCSTKMVYTRPNKKKSKVKIRYIT